MKLEKLSLAALAAAAAVTLAPPHRPTRPKIIRSRAESCIPRARPSKFWPPPATPARSTTSAT